MKYRLVAACLALGAVAVSIALGYSLLSRDGGEDYSPVRPMVAQGEVAPSFALEGADGKNVSLAEFRGKKNVLLYFSMGYG